MQELPFEAIAGVQWQASKNQWETTVETFSGDIRSETFNCLLDAVANRLRHERRRCIAGGERAIIWALEQENQELRQRVNTLELLIATSTVAGWELH